MDRVAAGAMGTPYPWTFGTRRGLRAEKASELALS